VSTSSVEYARPRIRGPYPLVDLVEPPDLDGSTADYFSSEDSASTR
jgi:hypothetical protein